MKKEITLPVSGEKVEIERFKGKHVITAQVVSERYPNPEEMIVPIIISTVCAFNGKRKSPEEILELDGLDFLTLQKEVFGGVSLPKNRQDSLSTSNVKEASPSVN